MKKRKKKSSTASDEIARNREILAEARRRLQLQAAPLAIGCMVVVRLFRDELWLVAAYVVPFCICSIRWIVGYRKLKAELGLAGEYDQLDENAAWSAKFVLYVLGGLMAFIVLLFGFMSLVGKH